MIRFTITRTPRLVTARAGRRAVGAVILGSLVAGALSLLPPIEAVGPPDGGLTSSLVVPEELPASLRDQRFVERFAATKARSEQRHRAKGHEPVGIEVGVLLKRKVVRQSTSLLDQIAGTFLPRLMAQEEVYENEGYGVFTSWDDQDDATWEGNIFIYIYENGRSGSLDLQVDISDDSGAPPALLWSEGDMEGGEEDEDPGPYPIIDPKRLLRGLGAFAVKTSGRPGIEILASEADRLTDCPCSLLESSGSELSECLDRGGVRRRLDNLRWGWPRLPAYRAWVFQVCRRGMSRGSLHSVS